MITELERNLRGYVRAMVFQNDRVPYIYGGAHPRYIGQGADCSGAVSEVLRAEGDLSHPRRAWNYRTEELEGWGRPGVGPFRTIYVEDTNNTLPSGPIHHAFIVYNAAFLAAARKLRLVTYPNAEGVAVFQAEHTGTFVGFHDNDGAPWGISLVGFNPRH